MGRGLFCRASGLRSILQGMIPQTTPRIGRPGATLSPFPAVTYLRMCAGEADPCPRTRTAKNSLHRRASLLLLLCAAPLPGALVKSAGHTATAAVLNGPVHVGESTSIVEAFEQIRLQCGPMIAAVREADGSMLFRGAPASLGSGAPSLVNDAPDLLDPGTYGHQGAAFFAEMQRCLEPRKPHSNTARPDGSNPDVRPSNGHIAVADQAQAGAWGMPCSCWPVGSFSYLLLASSSLIFPPTPSDSSKATIEWDATLARDLRVNEGLKDALREGKEVMFTAPNGYWLCPADLEPALRRHLRLPDAPQCRTHQAMPCTGLPALPGPISCIQC